MTGCYTCGGGMGKHDPVAHDQVSEDEPCLYCGESHEGWCPKLPPLEDEQ